MKSLKNRKLLFLDNTALAADAIRRAKELGIYTIAANYYPKESQPGKLIADVSIDVDIANVPAILEIIDKNKVDGVFVGWSDSHLPFYQRICEEAKLPCIGTASQFDVLSDKIKFKELCLKHNMPVIPYFESSKIIHNIDFDKIEFPVFVKPVDGSGSKGAAACHSRIDLLDHINNIKSREGKNGFLIERLIEDAKEIFLQITIQNGISSLSSGFTKHKISQSNGFSPTPILHVFPSSSLSRIIEVYWEKIKCLVSQLEIQNGILLLQVFEKNGEYMFIESGFRMGGEQFYVFTERLTGINSCEMMIQFALTGETNWYDVIKQDNPYFEKPCCNYYVPLKPGTISVMDGIDTVKSMPEVLQLAQIFNVGKSILKTSSLDIVCLRIHVMAETQDKLAQTLETISKTIDIRDEFGSDMQLEKLTYDRALEMIMNS